MKLWTTYIVKQRLKLSSNRNILLEPEEYTMKDLLELEKMEIEVKVLAILQARHLYFLFLATLENIKCNLSQNQLLF